MPYINATPIFLLFNYDLFVGTAAVVTLGQLVGIPDPCVK